MKMLPPIVVASCRFARIQLAPFGTTDMINSKELPHTAHCELGSNYEPSSASHILAHTSEPSPRPRTPEKPKTNAAPLEGPRGPDPAGKRGGPYEDMRNYRQLR